MRRAARRRRGECRGSDRALPCAHRELQEAAQRRLHGCAAATLQRQDRQEGAARPILAWARAAGFLERDQTFTDNSTPPLMGRVIERNPLSGSGQLLAITLVTLGVRF